MEELLDIINKDIFGVLVFNYMYIKSMNFESGRYEESVLAAQRKRAETRGADSGMQEGVEAEETVLAEKAREEKVARNKEIAASLAKLEEQKKKAKEASAELAENDPMKRVYGEILTSVQKETAALLAEFDGEPKQ